MHYEVDIGGRTRQVAVHRDGNRFTVTVDGRAWHVDAARVDAQTLSLILQQGDAQGDTAFSGGRSLEVTLAPDPVSSSLVVRIGAVTVPVVPDGRRRRGRPAERAAAGSGPQRVVAPMPGRIARVLVKTGEEVRARQPLVVVEAMKMENELRAGRDGVVAEIHAREGASVDAGALLVVIQ